MPISKLESSLTKEERQPAVTLERVAGLGLDAVRATAGHEPVLQSVESTGGCAAGDGGRGGGADGGAACHGAGPGRNARDSQDGHHSSHIQG